MATAKITTFKYLFCYRNVSSYNLDHLSAHSHIVVEMTFVGTKPSYKKSFASTKDLEDDIKTTFVKII